MNRSTLEEKIMCRALRFAASLVLLLGLAGTASAADVIWDGDGEDGLWSTTDNWRTNALPTDADNALINTEPGPVIDATVTADGRDVIIANADGETGRITMTGGTLTAHRTGSGGPGLWIGNRGIGYLDMSGGAIVADNVYLPRNVPGQGHMTMSDGSVTAGNTFTLGLHGGEYGEFTMTGGTVHVAKMFRCADIGSALMTVSGGTVTVDGTFYIGRRNGSGHLQLDGGTITVVEFLMDPQGGSPGVSMDLTGGTLVIDGDETANINGYIAKGWITAYGGSGDVNVELVDSDTVVTATMGSQAWAPAPGNGTTDVPLDAILSWSPGAGAAQHDVYFGTSFEDVNAASDPDVLPGRGRQDGNTYDPGPLALGQVYYWRIDEVGEGEPPTIERGNVWSFAALASLVVDDFEDYNNDSPNRVFQAWVDGYGYSADDFFPDGHPGNGTGMGVGHDIWAAGTPYTTLMETEVVHGGSQSVPLYYNNAENGYSEAERTFDMPWNWTAAGAKALSLWFYGNFNNQADRMYVAIEDNAGRRGTVSYEDPNALMWHAWHEWNIDLREFSDAGVDLTHVQKMIIGIGDADGAGAGASGTLFVDSIRLYPSRCVPEFAPAGDLDGDCDVDFEDLSILTENWLESFVWDVSGGFDGGGCLQLDGSGERIFVPAAPFPREAFTYALWFNPAVAMDTDSARQDLIYWSAGGPSPGARPALVHNIDGSGRLRISIMLDTMASGEEGLAFTDSRSFDADTWYHVAFTFDGSKTRVYVNGTQENVLTASGVHWQRYTPGIHFGASSGGGNGFNGKLDDIRIYGHALSAADIAGLAQATAEPAPGPTAWYKLDETASGTVVDASGNGYDGYVLFVQPYTNPYDDNRIDWRDYAVIAESWLGARMWP